MTLDLPAPDYARFLAALKERIRGARVSAARSVNHELISVHWDIGKTIAEKRASAGWGDAVVEKLSRDLNREFLGVRAGTPKGTFVIVTANCSICVKSLSVN